MKDDKKNGGPSTKRIADARFASFETDPRFRLPSKKNAKTKLDKRFAGMLKDKDFTETAKVDRYGRKIKSDSKKKALERLYEAEEDSEDKSDDDEEEEIEVEDDDVVQRELLAADKKYDPARGGGFSSSEEESDSDDDDSDDDEEAVEVATEGDIQRLQDEQADVEEGEVTKRIAIVNLDWDHVKSTDLFALFSSFLGEEGGSIVNVAVYPSEFGKERMQQEETEGPPKELFKSTKNSDSESDSEDSDDDERIKNELITEGDDQDFDSDALRKYQLDRLRYYYAVMECSSPAVAKRVYEATDGTEYQSSSNFIDLRFVPDDVTFDDEARDECSKLPETYKPIEFVTSALQSSKVKLTWDLNPEEASRKESIKRAFTGSRAELDENDLRTYLASDSESDDNDGPEEEGSEVEGGDDQQDGVDEDAPKLSKKELARKKMREALGLGDEPAPRRNKDGPVGEMEVTFTPALAEDNKKKSGDDEETTIEKYKRKERERKEKRREKARAKRGEEAEDEDEDEDEQRDPEGDLGFDDPFFTTEAPTISKSAQRKADRLAKREARDAAEAESASQKAHLAKVMAEDEDDEGITGKRLDHFDMNEIARAEKIRSKKGKAAKSKKSKDKLEKAAGMLQDDFEMDVADKRFQAVFDNHEFAIDPSNPKFKGTSGMKKLLEEGRNKRRGGGDDRQPKRARR